MAALTYHTRRAVLTFLTWQVVAKQRHRIAGVVRGVSGSGLSLYIEPKEVEAANTKLKTLSKCVANRHRNDARNNSGQHRTTRNDVRVMRRRREARACLRVRTRLSQTIGSPKLSAEIAQLADAVATIDAAAARGRYAAMLGGSAVEFAESRGAAGLSVEGARHPLLEWLPGAPRPSGNSAENSPSGAVPTDYEIGGGIRVVVVTGPNTGGKTIGLKTLGMCALNRRDIAKIGGSGRAEP